MCQSLLSELSDSITYPIKGVIEQGSGVKLWLQPISIKRNWPWLNWSGIIPAKRDRPIKNITTIQLLSILLYRASKCKAKSFCSLFPTKPMPSKTFIVRAHARTIHTRPVTFICAKCHQATTRECYPGTPPKYCLNCAPKKKKASATRTPEKGMFKPTHHLVAHRTGEQIPVCLETSPDPGWFWVRTALDWFSGESIIQYHRQKGLHSRDQPLADYSLEEIASDTGT